MSTYNVDGLSLIATRLSGSTPHAPDNTRGDDDWTAQALCASIGGDLWFPNVGDYTAHRKAIEICQKCPVTTQCLTAALSRREEGIWAGTTAKERERMRGRRRVA